MNIGHPELVASIASEIQSEGPIPFVRFMELALYHPQHGYYMRPPDPGTERIGWSGDYFTSSDVHSIPGQALAKQANQLDQLLGHPTPFTVVEMGPGKGLLAKHFLSTCRQSFPSLTERLQYLLIERSPAMRELQRSHLDSWIRDRGQVRWLESLDGLAPTTVTGLFYSNELVDAFPVHRIQMTARQTEEIYVDYRNGRFEECVGPLSTTALTNHLRYLNVDWPDGYRTEVNLQALDWIEQVSVRMNRGLVLTIDYGHTAQDLYRPDRKTGTFLCYHKQTVNESPYLHVGEQDMTAHVDFSSLASVGETCGLSISGFTNQMSFLMGLGIEEMVAALEPESREYHAALQLLRPNGMGSTFKVMVQHKGIPRPDLDGLRFKPFFGTSLAAGRDSDMHHASVLSRTLTTPGT